MRRALCVLLLGLAGAAWAARPADLRLVRVQTRTAAVFRQPDLQSARKGLAQFRDTFELLDDHPVNGFWKVQFTDGEGYIRALESQREAGPGDPSFQAGTQAQAQTESAAAAVTEAAGDSAPATGLPGALSAAINPGPQTGAGPKAAATNPGAQAPAGLNPGQQDLLRLPPKAWKGSLSAKDAAATSAVPGSSSDAAKAEAAKAAAAGPAWAPAGPPKWMVYMPLAWGLAGASSPAFRPSVSAAVSRSLQDASSLGLGMEVRLAPWAALYGEWTFNRHHTPSADRGQPAQPEGLSSSAAVTFPDADLDYVMQAHVFNFGARVGHYFAPLMPWLSLGVSQQAWDAFYLLRDSVQGQAQGQVTYLDASVGLDIYFKLFGAGVAKLTPTLAFLTPVVNASMPQVAGTGLAWADPSGTPVLAPVRVGVQLGIGF